MTDPTILVVEDEPKTRGTIRLYLEHEGFLVIEESDGTEAIRTARRTHPDLVVLDLMLPGSSGLDVCRTLRREGNVPIIMLTARAEEADKLKGLDLGADDYVTKPFSPRELVARIKAVLRRATALRPSAAHPDGAAPAARMAFGPLSIDAGRHEVLLHGTPVALTPAEFRLLETLARSPGRVFTREELVERAFGYDYDGLDRTVDVHIMKLRKKIEPDRREPVFVLTVFGIGYKFAGVPGSDAS
jgi:DNA-binding response OmpR family regulator